MRSPSISRRRHGGGDSAGLGISAIAYVGIDYLRHISPAWHERLQPVLWAALAIAAVIRVPFYKHWSTEFRAAVPFILSILFMLSALLFEMISVRSVTAVLGLDWHNGTPPLPDVGQWLLLALNEKLPQIVVDILRARIIGLHHFLMLFIMLGFSVLFNSVEAPGLGLAARYMFTMGIGRLLRAIAFVSTILPSPRPWCASARFQVPAHPHYWAQKYYIPYSEDSNAIRHIIQHDVAYAVTADYPVDFRPNWGAMNFLSDFLRPTAAEGSSPWYHLLKKAGGGCNDLLYSGHMLVAVLTAMAWTEAYGGYTSALIWILVAHSAQREIRERHHYTVDCIVAIYMGIFLWKMTGLFWPVKDNSRYSRLDKLEKIQSRLVQAAKDSDMDEVRELLKEVEFSSQATGQKPKSRAMWLFSGATIFFAIVIVLLAFTLTSDG
ncbi:sphingomyelin synthetase family protein [Striga asiatica]|uniref:Sphingomyelin synthetase family protein n=1 Tax=Striga asiatica TaxID=4170 RepID=A0A5A7PYB1_STRAF|nr:sphingomyelin synthetase family protein [Striga asiatica]